jgi:NAD(P) transhydrogenase subunit alpha
MRLFVLSESDRNDCRVSITPDVAKKLLDFGHQVCIERAAGIGAGFGDEDYIDIGATILNDRNYSEIDVVFSVNPLFVRDIESLNNSTIVISQQDPFNNRDNLKLFTDRKITAFGLDLMPRSTRAQYMDILSSQANLAGYKAVIEAAHLLNRALPLMMTTAGTIPAAKVLIVGAGVAGLQAIATARRLGARVSAFDVRESAKEQVESLGAKFIEVDSSDKMDGVYAKEVSENYKLAQEQKLRSVLSQQDIVVTTAQIPGKRAPIILKNDMICMMKKGSIIIDLASKSGGNCEVTEHGKTVERNGVLIVAFDNILNLIAHDASRLFAKNVLAFFELLTNTLANNADIGSIEDDIIRSTLLSYDGKMKNMMNGE